MDYKELEALGDRAKEISKAFYADCDAYGTKEAVNRYYARYNANEKTDLNEMLLIGAWRTQTSMVVKGGVKETLANTPMPLSHIFVQNRVVLFVDFLARRTETDSGELYPYIAGAFCAMRLQSPIQYTFDVVWYLSSKEVIACTWACDNVTGKDGTTSAILSPDVLNVPNVDALLFAWNAYHRAADMAFTQSAPQEHRYVQ